MRRPRNWKQISHVHERENPPRSAVSITPSVKSRLAQTGLHPLLICTQQFQLAQKILGTKINIFSVLLENKGTPNIVPSFIYNNIFEDISPK
jgi:hypothetical protein